MKYFVTLRWLAIIPLIFFPVNAQQRPIRLESLSLDEGISYQTAYALHQDSHGFLWIGTMSGLVRYDGYSNTVFRHDPANPRTLSHDDIVSIYEDRTGKIWVGTYGGGLNRFDPDTQLFERFVHDTSDSKSFSSDIAWTIAEDNDGKIWIGTHDEGINVFDPSRPNLGFRHYQRDPAKPSQTAPVGVNKIFKDHNGRIWIGSVGRGLGEFLPEQQQFEYHPLVNNHGESIRFYKVIDIQESGDELWITTDRGLRIWNLKQKTWVDRIPASCEKIIGQKIGKICWDNIGRLWIGTFGNGLLRLDTTSWTIDQTKRNIADPLSLKSDVVTVLFQDQSGLMWVGTALGGLQKNTPDYYKFESIVKDPVCLGTLSDENINALLADEKGIWVGSNGGLDLVHHDGSIEKIGHRLFSRDFPGVFAVSALWKDPDGSLWAGSISKGLFHRQQGVWKNYRASQSDTTSLSTDMISAIYRDRAGTLWVGSRGGGLHKLDEKSGRFIGYNRNNSMLPNDDILCLFGSSDSSIWVGTYGGLLCIPRHGMWKLYRHDAQDDLSLCDNYVFSLMEDRRGRLWIGTNRGLCFLDSTMRKFQSFHQKDGLPNEVINGIVEDASGMLWVSTQQGISSFDTEHRIFRNYDKADGLLSNMLNRSASTKDAGGKIYFGGINGVNVVDPQHIQDDRFSPQVQIVDFKKFDLPLGLPLDRSTELDYSDNFFTIAFSSMDFYAPEKNRFQFRLEPLEKSWRPAESRHTASYTNLEPGSYVFHVRGSNRDGYWSPYEAALSITIHPPFWKTKLFLAVSLLITALIGWAGYRISVRKKIQRAIALERVRISERDKMREQISKDFHDELGHKLTKISLFSELSRRALMQDPEESSEFLKKVSEASSSLSINTRDFIWALDPGKDTLYDVIVNLRDFAYDLFDKTGVIFNLKGVSESLERVRLSMDWRRHLTLIFKEALTNVLKHAHAKEVTLIVFAENDRVVISLQDDGRGFDVNSTDPNRNGLRNMKDRARRLGSTIMIENAPGKGTHVRFEANLKLPSSRPASSLSSWIGVIRSWFI